MVISATVVNEGTQHRAVVRTGSKEQQLSMTAKPEGPGSAVNGGELLFLALATCYCNDIYREAAERGLEITSVEVEVTGLFGGRGEPCRDIRYRASLQSKASEAELFDLMRHTDSVAEIHNTLRLGTAVTMEECRVGRSLSD
ncbi:OsmC family protein [Terriglobus roseus]|uniref:OsmC-like protein n=1 Tax=Terriglobus roseus TaxID=392734 RepID=A0A1H4R805_9BACT|nr:OsmC family protein [Terriglobus roseus]SEC27948.1 OsmC-like protein [Terriglobus roseus]